MDDTQRFDVVIVDPPAFAKRKAHVTVALKSYAKLAVLGAELVKDEGVLVLASCSSFIQGKAFRQNATRAVARSGKRLEVFEETGHPADHPTSFPEAHYLKCLYARVTRD